MMGKNEKNNRQMNVKEWTLNFKINNLKKIIFSLQCILNINKQDIMR